MPLKLATTNPPLLSPKGSNNKAQGNALGNRAYTNPSPERAKQSALATWLLLLPIAILLFGAEPALPLPLPLTFKSANEPLAKIVAEIAIQTKNNDRVSASKDLAESILPIDLQYLTFWKALDTVATAANAQLDLYHRSGRVMVTKKNAGTRPPVSYDGFFRSSIKKITASRDLEAGATHYTAQLEVAWEPRLEPLLLETRPHDVVVKNDSGKSIPLQNEGSVMAPVDGKLALTFDVPLPVLPRSSAKIGLIQGKLSAIAPTEMATFDFPTLSKLAKAHAADRRREKNGMICSLAKIDLLSDRVSIQVRLNLPPGGPRLESFQSWVVNNELWLERKDKSKRPPANYALDHSSSRSAMLSYHFTDKDVLAHPEQWTVKYRTPVDLAEVPFAFAFKDVPLP